MQTTWAVAFLGQRISAPPGCFADGDCARGQPGFHVQFASVANKKIHELNSYSQARPSPDGPDHLGAFLENLVTNSFRTEQRERADL